MNEKFFSVIFSICFVAVAIILFGFLVPITLRIGFGEWRAIKCELNLDKEWSMINYACVDRGKLLCFRMEEK